MRFQVFLRLLSSVFPRVSKALSAASHSIVIYSVVVTTGLAVARPVFCFRGFDGLQFQPGDTANPNQNRQSTDRKDTQAASEYRQQGLAYRQQGLYPQAIAALENAVVVDRDHVSGYVLLGWTQHLAGRSQPAAESLWQAIYRDPFAVEAFNALGIVYLVRGELSHAVLLHSWAAAIIPDNEIAYYNLSLAYQRQSLFDLAIANAKRAAELEPYNPHPLVALAIAYWDAGDRDAAIDAYFLAISVDGRYDDAGFLDYLDEAGFSRDQIQTAKQVLANI